MAVASGELRIAIFRITGLKGNCALRGRQSNSELGWRRNQTFPPPPPLFEITEGVLLEASEHTVSIFDAIRAIGFKIALDDFGTGYSSLAYLCNFKFDKIKIDRSFIGSISKVTSRRIVQSVITLGRGLGIDIVAEGVETEIEAVMMTHFGCTELQGYYFSKPIDADQMADFLSVFQPTLIVSQARVATG